MRETKNHAQELVVVSDSRLSGYGSLDCSPKIMQLPRSDTVLAYSGDTFFAYPIIHQISEVIRSNRSLHERVKDYASLRNQILKIMNEMYEFFHSAPKELENPETSFVLAGYSWFKKEFMIDVINFRKGTRKFENRPVGNLFGRGKVCFAGDMAPAGINHLKMKLKEKFGDYHRKSADTNSPMLDMEPFEVVRDMIRDSDSRTATIGGAPQIVTISQHMNSRQTAIYWPDRANGRIFLGGCPVLQENYLDNWILDPDNLKKYHLHYNHHRGEQ